MAIPSDRCGFILTESEDIERSVVQSSRYRPFRNACCWRETWKDHDRCIWHAEVDDKPLDELVQSRTGHPENFDGIYLKRSVMGDLISFEDCSLNHASFDGSYLKGTNFIGAHLDETSFKNTNICYTTFRDASISKSDFTGSNAQIISVVNSTISNSDFSSALVGGDFRGSDIFDSDFSNSEKGSVDFTGARLTNVDFSNSYIPLGVFRITNAAYCDFSNCDMGGCDFSFSMFVGTNFNNVDFRDCSAMSTDFEGSDFTGSSITQSDFRSSDIYRCSFQNVQVDRSTRFGGHYFNAVRPMIDINKFASLNSPWNHKFENWGGEDSKKLVEKRIWVLRSLQDLMNRNSLTSKSRRFYLARKDSQRELAWVSKDRLNWIFQSSLKYLMGYGENPYFVIWWSVVSILVFSWIYTVNGGVEGVELKHVTIDLLFTKFTAHNELLLNYLENMYFSGMTFSSLGYGDLQPSTWTVRIFATIQSLLGALLTALFVFVLGRRSSR